ncbi:MAG TPA: PLP-dependent aminotransferase family protein [Iamia sp.]|nr:PLP-dependent aminotransferase family protein [Iamia sp.]
MRTLSPATPVDLPSLLAGWSERGSGSLPRRLAQALRTLLDAGMLTPGTRLPPERRLAEMLAVSRGTITTALDELRAEGRIESRTGRGSEVAGGGPRPEVPHRISAHFLDSAAAINLSTGNPPDATHLPAFSLTPEDLTAEGGGHGLSPQGLPSLMLALAQEAARSGILASPDQVHVTNGSHHALALVAEALLSPGDGVVVEDPSYPGVFDVIDHLGARVIGLPRPHDGVDPHQLAAVLREHRPALVYLQGGIHNPLGRAPLRGRWRAVAAVLDEHAATVVEDRALVPMTEPDDRPEPLAALCRTATVITLGSIGKVAWGGLRIGWLIGPNPLVERTVRLRTVTDLGTSVPSQIITRRLLPSIDEMAAGRRATLRASAALALARLAEEAPDWEVDEPRGGSALWVRLPVPDAMGVVQAARRHGVLVAPGSVARAGGGPDPHLRICVDRPHPVVDEGLTRLLRAWREVTAPAVPVLG